MKIAFITDLHIGAVGEKPQGVDVRQNFLQALGYLEYIRPNCLVIGGDICNAVGDRATYTWAKDILDALPFSCYIIAGNHDNSAVMAEVFNLTHHLHGPELYYALPLEGRPALFLDTSNGVLSPTQWTWLREYLTALRDTNLLVLCTTHPFLPT
jgi:Icc protein